MAATVELRTQRVLAELRGDIIAGRLLPGQHLPFQGLTKRYDASVGVLREVLSRLAEQGLVVFEPRRGFWVASVSPDDLIDLSHARISIEALALREAIRFGDVGWESRIVAAHHILERTPETEPDDEFHLREEWAQAHNAFHEALLDGCPNRRLRQIASALRAESELYRRWSRQLGTETGRDVAAEHREIRDAVLAREVELAVALLSKHMERTVAGLIAITEAGSRKNGRTNRRTARALVAER